MVSGNLEPSRDMREVRGSGQWRHRGQQGGRRCRICNHCMKWEQLFPVVSDWLVVVPNMHGARGASAMLPIACRYRGTYGTSERFVTVFHVLFVHLISGRRAVPLRQADAVR